MVVSKMRGFPVTSTLRLCAAVLSAAGLLGAADFTYVQKTEITGGAIKRFIDLTARFSKQAGAPQTTTHRFSGDLMSVQSATGNMIYDLAKETITQVDTSKMEYSVITFAEMAEAMKKMGEKMAGGKSGNAGEMNWRTTVDITGNSKPVAGVESKEAIMKMFIEGHDAQSGSAGVTEIETTMWMGAMPGYEVARDFQRKMAAKMATTLNVNPMVLGQLGSGATKGLMEAGRKLAEMDGLAMETIMRMKGAMAGPGVPPPSAEPSGSASTPAPEAPHPNDVARDAAAEKAAEAAGNAGSRATRGRFGGLGGQMGTALGGRFGRRKKQEQPEEQARPQPETPPAATAASGDTVALESLTTIISFNNNPIDRLALTVPAGFTPVEHAMKKWLK